ncbi:MAG: hypothetical protein RIQ53_4455 [Pseudomonadota bacterium]|jgi:PqqD family protein of HPr-rel-A system
MTLPPPPGWRCRAAHALRTLAWDTEAAVVHDARSGDTHLIDGLAAQALWQLMRQGPATRQELAALLLPAAAADDAPAAQHLLDERLQRLFQRALIEPWEPAR